MDVCCNRALLVCALSAVCPLFVLAGLPCALWLLFACLIVARPRLSGRCVPETFVRPSQLHVYPLLNVLACCPCLHAHGNGMAVDSTLTRNCGGGCRFSRFHSCLYIESWVSRDWPLSSQPAGEGVTTVWHGPLIEQRRTNGTLESPQGGRRWSVTICHDPQPAPYRLQPAHHSRRFITSDGQHGSHVGENQQHEESQVGADKDPRHQGTKRGLSGSDRVGGRDTRGGKSSGGGGFAVNLAC